MYRLLNTRAHNTHLRDNSIDSHELVDQICLQTAGSNVIAPEVPIEVNIIYGSLFRELTVSCGSQLFAVPTLTSGCIVLHSFDCLVKLVLEHFNRCEWVTEYELCEAGVELAELIHVNVEAIGTANHLPYLLLALLVVEEILDHFL